MKAKTLSTPTLIHLFALAHAAIAILSRLANYVDDVPLTVLTLALVVVIALRHGLSAEMIALTALIGTSVGYLFGSYGAELIGRFIASDVYAPALVTALFTELLGWGVYAFARLRGRVTEGQKRWSPALPQIFGILFAILLFRISYTLIFNSSYFSQTTVYTEVQRLLNNTVALLVMLCGNSLFVTIRASAIRPEWRTMVEVITTLLLSAGVTLLVYFNFPQGGEVMFAMLPFLRLYSVVLLCDIVVFALMKMTAYVIASRAALRTEQGKTHLAQFQYNKLKLQINPHFLFNSLNILDFLVQEHETERASAFIRKLADTYRYMLKNEDETLVPLEEELTFARKYIELLKERFTTGFEVKCDIPEAMLYRHVVPCCLQLLIENATKHNIVSPEHPLVVTIHIEEELLIVSNNLQPRLSKQNSTGMGLKNICQQYADLDSRPVEIIQTESEFIVQLPLL